MKDSTLKSYKSGVKRAKVVLIQIELPCAIIFDILLQKWLMSKGWLKTMDDDYTPHQAGQYLNYLRAEHEAGRKQIVS
jgi:hypothetical protein